MAIATYNDLKTAVANWLHRTDSTTAAKAEDFIALAESRLNRRLRLRAQEETATLTGAINSAVVAIPDLFIEPLALWLIDSEGNRDELRYIDPDDLLDSYGSGEPEFWTIDGGNIRFDIKCDSVYTFSLRYRKGFSLSDTTTTNWLLTNHPDVYLYASLLEGAPFVRDNGLIETWKAYLDIAIEEVNLKEGRSRALATLSTDKMLAGAGTQSIITGD